MTAANSGKLVARARDETSDRSDSELVSIAQCAPDEFAQLYLRYADGIYRFALARTQSTTIADDIVSNTMLAAMQALDRFDSTRGSFSAWLFTIARNQIASYQRSERRLWKRIARAWSPPSGDDLIDPLIQHEQADVVRAALAQLSDDDQEILLLRFGAELSGPEISDLLGITSGAARVRVSRALKRLASALGDQND